MTPAARIAAAAELLDRILAGAAAEQQLTDWGRRNRFAGSGDRAAIRDLVFRALRCRRSHAALGGAETGRGLMLGALREDGADPDPLFDGTGHGPAPLTAAERAHLDRALTLDGPDDDGLDETVALDVPEWLAPMLRRSLAAEFAPVMAALRQRAPVYLRVNAARITPEAAIAGLAEEGITAVPAGALPTALRVTAGARRLRTGASYRDGLVELQDLASQQVAAALPLAPDMRVLDFCAGGGGKSLAMAARMPLGLFAHDADAGRMADLAPRAERAGAAIRIMPPGKAERAAPFDLVLVDAPCSGSGAWRRSPEAKWRLDPARLEALCALQARILDQAAALVGPGGWLAYATCSLLDVENEQQAGRFAGRQPAFTPGAERRWTPVEGGDGFYLALFRRGAEA